MLSVRARESSSIVRQQILVLSDTVADPDVARHRRRMVLISQNPEPTASAKESESDTDSIGGASEVDADDVHLDSVPDVAPPRIFGPQLAFASLDTVNFVEMFSTRAHAFCARDVFRTVVKAAMQEILDGTKANSELRVTRR